MCKIENYKRFINLARQFEDDPINHSRCFDTNLGKRVVECFKSPKGGNVIFIYYDKDNSPLFYLNITPEGRIIKKLSLIGDSAIFSAVYEIECLLYNISKAHENSILEGLFEITYDKIYNCGVFNYGFPTYR